MNRWTLIPGPVLVLWMLPSAVAQLQLAPIQPVQELKFLCAGEPSLIPVSMRNWADEPVTVLVRIRVFQASSATAVKLSDTPWKTIRVLPGQTILETTEVNFPAVKAETKFLVQWIEGTNHVIGTMEVSVYPTNLLQKLQPLFADDKPLGVLDPRDKLKPALRGAGVQFVDLAETVLDEFRGRLAIIGPFESRERMPDGLPGRIKTLAARGVPVVWIVAPPAENRDAIVPSFYTLKDGASCVVVAQPDSLKDFSDNPQSQLNLIHFCKLALRQRTLTLPYLTSEP